MRNSAIAFNSLFCLLEYFTESAQTNLAQGPPRTTGISQVYRHREAQTKARLVKDPQKTDISLQEMYSGQSRFVIKIAHRVIFVGSEQLVSLIFHIIHTRIFAPPALMDYFPKENMINIWE